MTGKVSRFLAVAGAVLGLSPALAQAQGTTISGQVTGTGGAPVAGASVSISTLRVGGFTDDQGRYTFTAPASATGTTVTLLARRLGFTPSSATVTLNGSAVTQNYSLSTAATELQGVVVTALGLTREKSKLGTAQQQLSTNDLNQTKTLNVINNIQGKVSGVNITGSGTQGGSNRIVFRGANSINGNNSPLFIVDGVALSNRARVGDPGGGYDFGSAIADINPDDIATMSILKGPNAAALYGSRAANGVIVLTTKKGASTGNKMRTDINTGYTWETPSVLPTYQNLYGQGAGGSFQYVDGQNSGDCDGCDQSYGPRLDGRLIDQFTGPQQPWVAHPDNVKSFFNTGHTKSTTVAVSGGTERANARLSFGSDNVEGYVPNNTFRKTNGLLNAALRINDRWNTDASLQYLRNFGANRPGVGYNNGIMEQFVWFGRQVDMEALRAYRSHTATENKGPSTREYNWNYNYHNNPFWLQFDNPLNDTRDRFVGSAAATYKLADGVNASLRTGSDIYRFNIDQRWAQGQITGSPVDQKYFGAFRLINDYSNENTTSLHLTADRQLGSRLAINALAGSSIRREQFSTTSIQTGGITVPGIYNVANAAITPTLGQTNQRRQVNSVYGSTAFTLNNWWTVEGTARNDWSSTLPKGKNSYFYPSLNTSVVLTDALSSIKGRVLTYAKIRASTARVGNDADPYQLRTTYSGLSNKYNGLAQYTLSDALANAELKPEITHSDEFGAELSFLDGRVTFDGSVYSKFTRNQIFNAPISSASGFSSKAVNAGKITNKGVDALLGITPIQLDNGFSWNTTFNYGRNKSVVTELAPGVSTILLGSLWNGRIEARLGEPYGAIYGKGFQKDSAGNLLLSDGLPQPTAKPDVHFGNIQPKWTGGWGNTITYKGMTLYGLLDIRRGGNIYSVTNMWADNTGVLARTLRGREVDWDNPGIVVKGIDEATGLPNTINVTSEMYFQSIYPAIDPYVYDASYVKLRELRFGVDLPSGFVNRFNASSVNLALTGRNLKTWTKVPNIDPEFSYTTGNYQGIEFAALPNARVWGLSLRITP
ncbi:MAG TPA: SusC/RagA family TonB-linked outer membrane protein [Gemmatimonadaceae bacterium]|nr:SusC/RagA family TonB-linked outer membrane protein [Gemmatimonadaceae bacterium]